jgi:hypothetical protein
MYELMTKLVYEVYNVMYMDKIIYNVSLRFHVYTVISRSKICLGTR